MKATMMPYRHWHPETKGLVECSEWRLHLSGFRTSIGFPTVSGFRSREGLAYKCHSDEWTLGMEVE